VAVTTVASNSNIFGGYRSFLVQSGSMEPTILIGDIVVAQEQPSYSQNETITFKDESGRVVTHRIIKVVNKKQFKTKGDANRSEDEALVNKENIIGKVVFTVPKLGYLVGFSKTPLGLIILVLVPALGLIIDELVKMKNAK
jgi:signal peptidase I